MVSGEQHPAQHAPHRSPRQSPRHSPQQGGQQGEQHGGGGGDGRKQSGGGVPDGLLLGLLALLLGLALFTWTATGLAALFSHGAWPDGVEFTRTADAMRSLVTEPHDVAAAWPEARPAALSGYGLFWGIFISQMLVVLVLTVFVLGTLARARAVRAARRAGRTGGLPEARSGSEHTAGNGDRLGSGDGHGSGERAGAGNAAAAPSPPEQDTGYGAPAHLVPEREPEAPLDLTKPPSTGPGPGLASGSGPDPGPGTEPGKPAPAVAPLVAVPGPPQAPSGAAATDASGPYGAGPDDLDPYARVHDAPGAVLVATRDPQLWAATKDARGKLGPVHVFDPGHLCDTPDRLRWSPHRGCADRQTAAARAEAMLEPLRSWRPPRPVDADVHAAAETLLRCWLHAAALADRPFREIHRWAQSGKAPSDPVQTLRTHPEAAPGSAGELEATLTGHPERRRAATDLVRRVLAPLSQLHVRQACTSGRADRVALDSFLHETGTLYVVGADPDVMPLVNALARSVADEGRRIARASASRLDPPLTEVLELAEAGAS